MIFQTPAISLSCIPLRPALTIIALSMASQKNYLLVRDLEPVARYWPLIYLILPNLLHLRQRPWVTGLMKFTSLRVTFFLQTMMAIWKLLRFVRDLWTQKKILGGKKYFTLQFFQCFSRSLLNSMYLAGTKLCFYCKQKLPAENVSKWEVTLLHRNLLARPAFQTKRSFEALILAFFLFNPSFGSQSYITQHAMVPTGDSEIKRCWIKKGESALSSTRVGEPRGHR